MKDALQFGALGLLGLVLCTGLPVIASVMTKAVDRLVVAQDRGNEALEKLAASLLERRTDDERRVSVLAERMTMLAQENRHAAGNAVAVAQATILADLDKKEGQMMRVIEAAARSQERMIDRFVDAIAERGPR